MTQSEIENFVNKEIQPTKKPKLANPMTMPLFEPATPEISNATWNSHASLFGSPIPFSSPAQSAFKRPNCQKPNSPAPVKQKRTQPFSTGQTNPFGSSSQKVKKMTSTPKPQEFDSQKELMLKLLIEKHMQN